MPRKAVDYSKTVMYKFVCNDLNVTDVYAGHTTQFVKRKNSHKFSCTNANSPLYDLKIYQIIRANGGWADWSMIEIEKYPCNDGNEARFRERYWFEQLGAKMNTQVPNQSHDDYLQVNKEAISDKAKVAFQCQCGSICRIRDKLQHNKTFKHINFTNSQQN